MASKAKRETVAARRAKWAAQAQAERDRVKADPEYRLAWLRRPCIKRSMKPATWRAKVEEANAALGGASEAKRFDDFGVREAAKAKPRAARKAKGKARG
jgi:hypothetical protein